MLARVLLAALVLFAGAAHAATHYIRDGGTASTSGTGSCTGWATANACDQFPATLVSGDTYYLADGSYSAPAEITVPVTIKKCNPTDNSGDANYSSAYCDGQATVNGSFVFAGGGSGSTINGAYRNESDWGDSNAYGLRAGGVYSSRLGASDATCADNLTIRYLNVGLTDPTTEGSASDDQPIYLGGFGGGSQACSGWLLHRSYVHGFRHYTMIQCAGCDTLTVEYTRFAHGWGKETIRGQITATNMVVRWNQFYDACGSSPPDGCTAEIALWDGTANQFDGNKVYGNWFYQSNTNGHTANSGGTIVIGGDGSSWAGSPANNVLVYNNTIAGSHAEMQVGHILVNGGTGNVCQNNLWYDVNNASASCGTSSYNTEATSNPFVSYPSDLRLSGATAAGNSLSSPYNVDVLGVTRGSDGTWDRGAYEYGSGSKLPGPGNPRWRPADAWPLWFAFWGR